MKPYIQHTAQELYEIDERYTLSTFSSHLALFVRYWNKAYDGTLDIKVFAGKESNGLENYTAIDVTNSDSADLFVCYLWLVCDKLNLKISNSCPCWGVLYKDLTIALRKYDRAHPLEQSNTKFNDLFCPE